jgi:hypothetical protein
MYVNNVDIACSTSVDSGACLINYIKKNKSPYFLRAGMPGVKIPAVSISFSPLQYFQIGHGPIQPLYNWYMDSSPEVMRPGYEVYLSHPSYPGLRMRSYTVTPLIRFSGIYKDSLAFILYCGRCKARTFVI